MEEETKSNLTDKGTWRRLVVMLLFAVIFNIAELVLWAVVVIQFLFKLLTGAPNEKLREFGRKLAVYAQQIIGFLTYHTEEKPYPFGDWPGGAGADNTTVAMQKPPAAAAAKAAPARKRTAKPKSKPADDTAPKAENGKPSGEAGKE